MALTYGLKIRDGLGSQTARMLGVYAIAHASGLQYHHSPFECIGHIGGAPHYRDARCDNLPESDLHKMRRIAKHIRLPSSSAVNASAWEQQYLFRADWDKLASVAAAALQAKQPTLVGLELTDEFISPCPDIFYHVPAWRPQKYLASQWVSGLACSISADALCFVQQPVAVARAFTTCITTCISTVTAQAQGL